MNASNSCDSLKCTRIYYCSFVEPKTPAHHSQAMDTDAAENIAILYRDQSDIAFIKDVFGGALRTSVLPFFSSSPLDFNTLLTTQAMRSCHIIVEAGTIVQELLKESSAATPYLDLLRTARNAVGKSFTKNEKASLFYQLNLFIGLLDSHKN